jgi:hypothetical protein
MLSIYPRGFFLSFVWLIVWHAASAVFLWRGSRAAGPTSAETVEFASGTRARAGI